MKFVQFIKMMVLLPKFFLVVPYLLCYLLMGKEKKKLIEEDVDEMNRRCHKRKNLAYYLIVRKPYRNLFCHRLGRNKQLLGLFLPLYKDFYIAHGSIGGGSFVLNHPYSTIINAKSIGKNFTVCQLTTIGNKTHGRNDLVPTIGNNVTLGANVNIIGDVTIGDNVIVGAGSVVIKDVPSNCIVAGNPAKIIRTITNN